LKRLIVDYNYKNGRQEGI